MTKELTRKPIYNCDEEVGYLIIDDEGYVIEEHYYEDDA